MCAYSGYEDGSWSSDLLFAKNLLCPPGWTTPQAELHALSSIANMAKILEDALGSWIKVLYSASDSTIAISWAIYEKVRLHIFHRLRVSNIRNKLDFGNLFHVDGKENASDIGTRPDLLKPENLVPGSTWMTGSPWMKLDITSALDTGIIKKVDDIKMDNEAKKSFKEGVMLESSLNLAVHSVSTCDANHSYSQKVVDRENFSQYVYPPLKRSFPSFVRVTAYVLLAYNKFKRGMVISRQQRNLPVSDGSDIKSIELPPPRFSVFSSVVQNTSSKSMVRLDDKAISLSLDYIYRKTTLEVLEFNDKKLVKKVGTLVDGVLFCKSRLMEDQSLRALGGLENIVDLETFTGINFKVPVIDRFSPVGLSIANLIHFNVVKHKGVETTQRLSLQHVRILGGRTLFKRIRDDCIFCKKQLLKHIQQIMGPLADQQLTISPIFFFTLVDAWDH